MSRTHYRNGDEIALEHTGCDGCSPGTINGVFCHEPGCTEAWRDYSVECFECGCDFWPEEKRQRTCPDCLDPPDFDDDEEPEDERDCPACGEDRYADCFGGLRCPECDPPCPGCDDGGFTA